MTADPTPTTACSNCDGIGRYVGWPHTKCPICDGSGSVPEGSDYA